MRLLNNASKDTSKIRGQIKKINEDTIECVHTTSNYKVMAYIKSDMKLEIGQVVLLEYRKGPGGGGYIVADSLMEEITATVLEAQHIISNNMMFTSLIMENPETHKRMHSLVPSNNNLFSDTSVIITGDKVKLRINNGNLFSINIGE